MGCSEWLEMNQKNKPQSNALATGILTLLTTGSYLAATLFDSGLSHQEWTFGRSQPAITFTLLVFHVTAVAGSIAAYLLLERYTKKQINYVLVACVTVASIVGIAVPSNLIAVAFGRGLMGFAHGLAYPVVLVHGGEIVVKELRGVIIASVNFCIVSGVMLGSVINTITQEDIPPYRLLGILGLVYMLLSVFLNYFLCYESPVFLVERKLDGQAIQSMIKLRNESNETWQIRNELTEIKTMLSEDELTSRSILQDGNLRPLVLIALGKLAAVLSFNYAVNSIKYIVIDQALAQDYDTFSLATTILMTIRLLGGMVGMFIVDVLGRRALAAVSSLSTGLLLAAIGITYLATDSLSSEVAMVFLFACEVGSSLGLTFVPDVLCSEAFNTRKKLLSIVVVQLVENVLQVIIFAITFEWNFAVQDRYGGTLLVAGVPLVAIAYVLYQKLPETSKMSIRQARIEFYKRDGIVFGGSKNSVEVLYD